MRKNGVLLHISSLPSNYGIGTLGQTAKDFVDQLERNGQTLWQILPVCPTSFGDSPYASYSTFAGNPYFIDLDMLASEGYLYPDEFQYEKWYEEPGRVDYGIMYNTRYPILKKAVARFLANPPKDYEKFLKDNKDWLEDYSLFMAFKDANEGKPWQQWEEEYRVYDPKKIDKWKEEFKESIDFNNVLQYLFFEQWNALRKYANDHGVEIIGDLPIYVAMDSVDAWSHPELFMMDADSKPQMIAAVPPDGFSADGQLWGNPVYNWPYHKKTGYDWWIRRIEQMTKLYNIVRIDHFRGFDSFYAVKADAKDAKKGIWMKGPGAELFDVMRKKIGEQKIIAEDLGYLTKSVRKMLSDTGYPGMKVMEFGFDSKADSGKEYLPYNYPQNCVAYAGTHDNDTIYGWFESLSEGDKEYVREYLDTWDPEWYNWRMFSQLLGSPADTTIVMAQDLLRLGSDTRMNQPGSVGTNWQWRLKPGELDEDTMSHLKYLTRVYGRLPEQNLEKEEEEEDIKVYDPTEIAIEAIIDPPADPTSVTNPAEVKG